MIVNLYRNDFDNPKVNAQRNLAGRTHYVDDDTLRYHKSRIIKARAVDNGLFFALVESVAVDPPGYGNRREFRFVIFDVFGHVVGNRPELGNGWTKSATAEKAMWATLDALDAQQVTYGAIERETRHHQSEMIRLRDMVNNLYSKKAA